MVSPVIAAALVSSLTGASVWVAPPSTTSTTGASFDGFTVTLKVRVVTSAAEVSSA